MRFAFSLMSVAATGGGKPHPIQAVVRPELASLVHGDEIGAAITPADWDQPSNYLPEGSTVTATVFVNDVEVSLPHTVSFDDDVRVEVFVAAPDTVLVDGDGNAVSFEE